jgi:3D (Asp-Asp-Asp) domain-containing protein
MLGFISKKLKQISILTAKLILDLRESIAADFPGSSPEEAARRLAGKIQQLLDERMGQFAPEDRRRIKTQLLREAIVKNDLEITAADLFQAGLALNRENDRDFQARMAEWINQFNFVTFRENDIRCCQTEYQKRDASGNQNNPEYPDFPTYRPEGSSRVAPPIRNGMSGKEFWDNIRRIIGVSSVAAAGLLAFWLLNAAGFDPGKGRNYRGVTIDAAGVLASAPATSVPARRVSWLPQKPALPAGRKSAVPEGGIFQRKITVKATAYDLSVTSCGKTPDHPEYGITFCGTKARTGRTIAVDPSVIPLGSRVFLDFPAEYQDLNGWYIAEDTGAKVKGDRIDVFFGEDRDGQTEIFKRAQRFGVQMVEAYVMKTEE